MKMQCPQCDFNGEFKKAKVPFFMFSVLHSHIATNEAKKTFVCPNCGCNIKRTDEAIKEPLSRVILYIVITLFIVGSIIVLAQLENN